MRATNLDNPSCFPDSLAEICTPAFVYDEMAIHRLLDYTVPLRKNGRCNVLFAIKSFSFAPALRVMAPCLDGFAVSSLFEARLAREVLGDSGSVHITTPGLRLDEIDEISALCDHVAFNSLGQLDRFRQQLSARASIGLRVNPQLSFADDCRYDPCRPQSKLGVPLDELEAVLRNEPARLDRVSGILFHSNCDSPDFAELRATVDNLRDRIPALLRQVEWVNLGGGYLFEDDEDEPVGNIDALCQTIDDLRSEFGVQMFIEPGSGLIRAAGYFVATVLDLFPSGGATVAVLDTSVNHMPEVFEYGFQPDVVGAVASSPVANGGPAAPPPPLGACSDPAAESDTPHEYLLAGCTCLAGDLFGTYRFPEPLAIGDRVVFRDSGSYTLTKASMFNGVALPSVYALTTTGDLALHSSPSYPDFAARWGLADRVQKIPRSLQGEG